MDQAGLGKKRNPISKITKAKRTEGVNQGVEHLPCKCKALNSNPSTGKKSQKNPQKTKRKPPKLLFIISCKKNWTVMSSLNFFPV
jgi:hypothetical protein